MDLVLGFLDCVTLAYRVCFCATCKRMYVYTQHVLGYMLNYSTQQRHGQVRRQAQLYICWGSLTACLSLQFSRASVLLVADFSCSSWMRETFTAALSSSRLFSFSSVSCLSLEDAEGGGVQFKSNSNVMYVENTSIYNTLRGPIIPIHWNNKDTSWIRPFSHTTESHSSLDCQSTKAISPLVTDCSGSSLPFLTSPCCPAVTEGEPPSWSRRWQWSDPAWPESTADPCSPDLPPSPGATASPAREGDGEDSRLHGSN